jgi:hypothetical protein
MDWIPVEERLPKKEHVLIRVLDSRDGAVRVKKSRYIHTKGIGSPCGFANTECCCSKRGTRTYDGKDGYVVTHWMPLPEGEK